jgi:sRNA-binding carbon storage regulator CsrA
MALVLGMQEGRSFFLNDIEVKILKIATPQRATLEVNGYMITKVTIGPNHRTELIPGVYASIGTDSTVEQIKVALEAPRNIKILRDNLYHDAYPDS